MKKSTGVSPSVNVEFPWRSPFRKEDIGQQIPEGDIQMYNLARRFSKRFPELLRGRTSVADFNFTSSFVLRVTQSAIAFGLGYLKGRGHVTEMNLQPIPFTSFQRGKDRLHRWNDDCPKWQKSVVKNSATFAESKKFLKSYTFQKIVHKVREKLGLVNVKEVDEDIVLSMFRACGWSVQAFGDSEDSGWCSLFTPEDQKIYDFYVDLYIYNVFGPGNQLNPDQSCVLVQDIFNSLKRKTEEMKGTQNSASKAIFRFGHGETVISPLNKLGLFLERVPFTADNYKRLRDRVYRTGMIAPMGGNIAFVLYKCVYGEYKIQFYHHERLTKLPGCPSKMHCTLKELLSYYEDNINECANQFEQVCKV